MALPAIRAVKDAVIVAHPSLAPVFPGMNVTSKIPRADRIILLKHSFRSAFDAWRLGIPERIGYAAHFRSPLLTQSLTRQREHQIDEYIRLVELVGYSVKDRVPKIQNPKSKIPNLVVLAPGAKYGSAKRWPFFEELARRITGPVKILGASGERCDANGPHIENLIGWTSLAEALDILASADLVIANDSGLAHAARALGKRTIVLFGPTDASRTAPHGAEIIQGRAECAPCGLRICPIDHRCMHSITVDEVLEKIA